MPAPKIAAVTPPLLLTRPADAPPQNLADYQREGGYTALRAVLRGRPPAEVIGELATAQLRGRGGASFPTATKWQLAAAQPAMPKYVVGNGGEHEPGSRKDRFLVENYPHKVLEGMLLCGYATGAIVSTPRLGKDTGIGQGFDFFDDEVGLRRDGAESEQVAEHWLNSAGEISSRKIELPPGAIP